MWAFVEFNLDCLTASLFPIIIYCSPIVKDLIQLPADVWLVIISFKLSGPLITLSTLTRTFSLVQYLLNCSSCSSRKTLFKQYATY